MSHIISKDIQEFLEKSSTQTFLNAAKQFINLLEIENIEIKEFYSKVHEIIINLYFAGHNLEHIQLKYSNPEIDYDRGIIFENKNLGLISQLGKDAYYLEVFDPTKEDENEITQGWLEDDFADIYQDLKIELLKIENITTNEAIEDALWQLKWGFHNHWGNHCINAIRALHYIFYEVK